MTLVGYHSTIVYKLYDATNKIIVINRDVVFDEIKQLQLSETNYQQIVTNYNNGYFVSTVLEDTESIPIKEKMEYNLSRSTRQRGFPTRLQDCEYSKIMII